MSEGPLGAVRSIWEATRRLSQLWAIESFAYDTVDLVVACGAAHATTPDQMLRDGVPGFDEWRQAVAIRLGPPSLSGGA